MQEKFVSPEPMPDEHDQELLTILMEELMEVGIRASKMKRFGVLEVQPGQEETNRARLGMELGDVSFMVDLCLQRGLILGRDIQLGRLHKQEQLAKFLQTHSGIKDAQEASR